MQFSKYLVNLKSSRRTLSLRFYSSHFCIRRGVGDSFSSDLFPSDPEDHPPGRQESLGRWRKERRDSKSSWIPVLKIRVPVYRQHHRGRLDRLKVCRPSFFPLPVFLCTDDSVEENSLETSIKCVIKVNVS